MVDPTAPRPFAASNTSQAIGAYPSTGAAEATLAKAGVFPVSLTAAEAAAAAKFLAKTYGAENADSAEGLTKLMQNPAYQYERIQKNGKDVGVFAGVGLKTGFQIDYLSQVEAPAAKSDVAVGFATLRKAMDGVKPNFVMVEASGDMVARYKSAGFQKLADPASGAPKDKQFTMMALPMNADAVQTLKDPAKKAALWVDHAKEWYTKNFDGVTDKDSLTRKSVALAVIEAKAKKGELVWIEELPAKKSTGWQKP